MKDTDTIAERNIEIGAEFSRYLFEHPEIEASLPAGSEIVLLPELDAELCAHNESMGRELEAQGEAVVYIRIGRLRPKRLSRIESLAIAP